MFRRTLRLLSLPVSCQSPISAQNLLCLRLTSSTSSSSTSSSSSPHQFKLDVYECDSSGHVDVVSKGREDLVRLRAETKLPLRDFRLFFQQYHAADSIPLILSRPSSNCYILSLEHVRLLCRKDRCMILGTEDKAVETFVADLKEQLKSEDGSVGTLAGGEQRYHESSMHAFLNSLSSERQHQRFELVVLETALHAVTDKFKRHLNLLKPVIELLLRETSSNPSAAMLRRMLAFRKSLAAFEMSVTQVRSAVTDILRVDVDLAGMVFADNTKANEDDALTSWKEEAELLMEAYNSDLKEIECELKNIRNAIEDTNDFINIHLNSIRNRIIKMSLYMEMGTMAIGTGALTAGIFGMNLTHGLEEHSTAFFTTCGGILIMVGGTFGVFAHRFTRLERDSSSARSYQALKNFFSYVEDIEMAIHAKKGKTIKRSEFSKLLEPVIGTQLTKEEVDSIFRALDENADGTVDIAELGKQQQKTEKTRKRP